MCVCVCMLLFMHACMCMSECFQCRIFPLDQSSSFFSFSFLAYWSWLFLETLGGRGVLGVPSAPRKVTWVLPHCFTSVFSEPDFRQHQRAQPTADQRTDSCSQPGSADHRAGRQPRHQVHPLEALHRLPPLPLQPQEDQWRGGKEVEELVGIVSIPLAERCGGFRSCS